MAGRLGMTCEVRWPKPKRVAIFVSNTPCLWELLLRHDAGELPGVEIVQIVSNHEDLRHVAEHFSVPYAVFKVTKDTKRAVEDQELALLKEKQVDLVVLARYMQIITDEFCDGLPAPRDQHPPLVPAGLHRVEAVPGARARRESSSVPPPTTRRRTSTKGRSSSRTAPGHKNSIDDLLRLRPRLDESSLWGCARGKCTPRRCSRKTCLRYLVQNGSSWGESKWVVEDRPGSSISELLSFPGLRRRHGPVERCHSP